MEEFQEKDSGWALRKIVSLGININKYEMGNGASSFIKLPEQVAKKQGCINVKNYYDDDACFAWSIVSGLYPVTKNSDLTSSYPHYSSVLNLEGIEFPMTLAQISKFEKLNNISVNVYILELSKTDKGETFNTVPARLTKHKLNRHVNLLMIQNKYFPKLNEYDPMPTDNEIVNINYHYCWIKDLSRLVSKQLSKHDGKKFICDRCLNYFSRENKLLIHSVGCAKINECEISFSDYEYIEFKKFYTKQTLPFIIYADFESMLVPIEQNSHSKTEKYQSHTPFSAGYYLKCSYDNSLSCFKSYRGSDCMEWFAKELEKAAQFIQAKNKNIIPMEVQPNRAEATVCRICEKRFCKDSKIVADHDHYTGAFRSFAHAQCNLNYRKAFSIPVVFHNLSGYDAHFVIKFLGKNSRVSLLPINKERYISFTQHDSETDVKFRFIDSFKFLGASLNELTATLEHNQFQNLKNEFNNLDAATLKLLMRKGVFCYDYVDSWEKLEELHLPPIDMFYNKLNDSNITDDEYAHAKLVWAHFNNQNLGEYSDLYLKADIMLLTDIFENFRDRAHKTYGLDPAWSYTMPGYTWECMLKYTKCKLDTLQDVDMLLFMESGIRGGISQCCNRFAEANNKYLPTFNSTKPSSYLLYLDVNSLYGWAMMEPLPQGDFQWMENVENFAVSPIPDDAPEGYFLEVDITYPEHLHDFHKDFPLCPEQRIPPGSKLPKLLTTLYDKKNYIIHYRNLKQALNHGLVLTKIHRILKFNQSAWLKPYIELNTKLRAQAKTPFDKNLYKIATNAVFGKTMENLRKHRIVKLVNKWEGRYGAKNLIAAPNYFYNRIIFDTDLMAIEMKKMNICFNKPLYIGQAILDISKGRIYSLSVRNSLRSPYSRTP